MKDYRTIRWWITLPLRLPFVAVLAVFFFILAPNDSDNEKAIQEIWRGGSNAQ